MSERATLADRLSEKGKDLALKNRVQSLRLPEAAKPVVRTGAESTLLPWTLVWILGLISAVSVTMLALRDRGNPGPTSTSASAAPTTSASTSPSDSSKAGSAPAAPAGRAKTDRLALEVKGYIVPARQILVTPKVSGMLTKVFIQEGMKVRTGDVLATVENIEYEKDRNRTKAAMELAMARLNESERGLRPEEVAQAEAELREAQANLTNFARENERLQSLLIQRSANREEADRAETQYQAQKRRVERLELALKLARDGNREERKAAARAEYDQARAEFERAQWRFDNCSIRAPIDGTILKKNAEEGNVVNSVAFNGSYSLCDMANLAELEVDLSVQERDVSKVFAGQRCEVRVEAWTDRVYDGVVDRLRPIADRGKGAIPVRVKVTVPAAEEGIYLKPDMGAIVSFLRREEPPKGSSESKPASAGPTAAAKPSPPGAG